MTDLSRPWPLGLDGKGWWKPALACVVALAFAAVVDAPISIWAQGWPAPVQSFMATITNLGLGDWIFYPSALLFAVTAVLARLVRWRLMRTVLWQMAGLYAFIFVGTALPGLIGTIIKRIIGRGRPMHLADSGLFGLKANLFDWTYQSFPSGHATTIFALAMVTAFLSARLLYPALAVAVLVGVSRVALGAHYPSDVVGGAILGVLGAYLARWIFAQRSWMFTRDASGAIHVRPMAALKRYVALKQRGIAPAPRPGPT